MPKAFEFDVSSGDVIVRKPIRSDYVLIYKDGILVAKIPVEK